jgi:hypothetical protein
MLILEFKSTSSTLIGFWIGKYPIETTQLRVERRIVTQVRKAIQPWKYLCKQPQQKAEKTLQ